MFLHIFVVFLASFTINRLEGRAIRRRNVVTSIQTIDGDVFDCFDIYKQPAFDNPSLKNHKLQKNPNFIPSVEHITSSNETYAKFSLNGGICPSGTVPILRINHRKNIITEESISSYLKADYFPTKSDGPAILESPGYLAAMYYSDIGSHYGSRASLNVWNPQVSNDQFSTTRITLWSWDEKVQPISDAVNLIRAGWAVHPKLYGDNKTRFMTSWTADGYSKTGCYDSNCPGFVHVSESRSLGSVISTSTYDGPQIVFPITIVKDYTTKHWWLLVREADSSSTPVGYWPKELFTTLSGSARRVVWSGETYHNIGTASSPPMGSGHFPNEGLGKAAYIENIELANEDNSFEGVSLFHVGRQVDAEKCYDAVSGIPDIGGFGFLLGGPGGDCEH